MISESDLISFVATVNVELTASKCSTHHYEVKEVKTGFESLKINNLLNESGKVNYFNPSFIATVELF